MFPALGGATSPSDIELSDLILLWPVYVYALLSDYMIITDLIIFITYFRQGFKTKICGSK